MNFNTKLSNKPTVNHQYIPKHAPNRPLPPKLITVPIEADPDEYCSIPNEWKENGSDTKDKCAQLKQENTVQNVLDNMVEPPPLREADDDQYLKTPNEWRDDDNISKPYPRYHKKLFIQQHNGSNKPYHMKQTEEIQIIEYPQNVFGIECNQQNEMHQEYQAKQQRQPQIPSYNQRKPVNNTMCQLNNCNFGRNITKDPSHNINKKNSNINKKHVSNYKYIAKPLPPTPSKKICNKADDSKYHIHHNNNTHVARKQQKRPIDHMFDDKDETSKYNISNHQYQSQNMQIILNNYNVKKVRNTKTTQIGENEENIFALQYGPNGQQNQCEIQQKTMSSPNIELANNRMNQYHHHQNEVMSQPNMCRDNNINPKNCNDNIISMEGIPNSQNVQQMTQIGQYPSNDTRSNNDYDTICEQAFVEINKIRQNPKCLIPRLKEIKKNMKSYGNCWESEGRVYKEGAEVIDDAITFLKKQESVGTLKANKELAKSAMCPIQHPSKIAANGAYKGHIPNLQNVVDAHSKSDRNLSTYGENIMYGVSNGADIICALIIDDGVRNRGHRKNIFKTKFKEIGFATGMCPEKRIMFVSDFAAYFPQSTY